MRSYVILFIDDDVISGWLHFVEPLKDHGHQGLKSAHSQFVRFMKNKIHCHSQWVYKAICSLGFVVKI